MKFERQIHTHGFVRVVDTMGNDDAIVDAARCSYGSTAAEHAAPANRGLIRYMMRHRHSTPFEMCEIKLHVRLPIFVARQWIRHRTANVNEYSARYSEVPDLVYIPEPERLRLQSEANKQGGGAPHQDPDSIVTAMETMAKISYEVYSSFLESGLSREEAREVLSVNYYTEWYWKIDLHNLFGFLQQRMDSHAQQEIRDYADAIADFVKSWVPVAWEAFEDYRLGAVIFSRQEMEVLRSIIQHRDRVIPRPEGSTAREWEAFQNVFGILEGQ